MTAWALLRDARRQAGLSQSELARLAGAPQSTIAKIERGRREPSLATLRHLVRAAGLDLRCQLVPRDADEVRLIDAMLQLTPEARLRALEEQSGWLAEIGVPHASG
ncbi:MAG TPA: helix-turn-helix transcriptional regulator [Gaiellaceae bacterium]|nr:helix-turn-helix transcriptional regulator [Gaiellaceae bacterium]